jgi:creatinine amidohydrolase
VNGHGGNDGGRPAVEAWAESHAGCAVQWHNWWAGGRVRAVVNEIDPEATHASWFENFPWTRLPGVELPSERKPMADVSRMRELAPREVRELLGDGSLGGAYERPEADVLRVWTAGVEEVRALLDDGWDA